MRLPVLALALGALAIGTTEFVTMGLLPEMAATFEVSIPSAGWLVASCALGVVALPTISEPEPGVGAVAA